MFIQNLNIIQQAALIAFAKQIISIDGHVDGKEELMLDNIRLQCDVLVNVESNIGLGELANIFEHHHQKVSFMLELIGIAHADETYQETEKTFIGQIAEALDISSSLLNDLENWVMRQIILVKESSLLMEI
ncbi:TPA: TerB family tellurite resistance protein [Vibrio cholerae]|nr:TerB family tellurite resistance protein [Vibrio cholerae]